MLEASKDLVVGPGLHQQVLFPRSTKLLSLCPYQQRLHPQDLVTVLISFYRATQQEKVTSRKESDLSSHRGTERAVCV